MNFPLRTAFTVSHRFWVVVFSFSFVSMHILIFFYFFCDLLVIQQEFKEYSTEKGNIKSFEGKKGVQPYGKIMDLGVKMGK